MKDFSTHIINQNSTLLEALIKLNELEYSFTLFVIDDEEAMVGTLTDGDIRRGLINGKELKGPVKNFMHKNYRFLLHNNFSLFDIKKILEQEVKLIPILNEQKQILRILDLTRKRSLLPLDVVIMAGGRGERLRPLTDTVPKPLLKIGDKPIIEHNIDKLIDFGLDNYFITVNYLGDKIIDYFGDGIKKGIKIKYVKESKPLGTIGAVSMITEFKNDHIIIMNSDLYTDLNFEDFYLDFLEKGADMSIATISYVVDVPYAVLETKDEYVLSFKEKPTYTYYSNAGIYLIKKQLLKIIPQETFYNATDLIQTLSEKKYKVINFPIVGYWIDIGKLEDYKKAQEFYKYLKH